MRANRTLQAISGFFSGANLPENWLPVAIPKHPNPDWLEAAALGGKKTTSPELLSIFDLLTPDPFLSGKPAPAEPESPPKMPFSEANAELYLENLLLWGQQNLANLPSADAYVSRSEAGRLAAAFAGIGPASVSTGSPPPVTLLAGDLSGVQDFIYTITNKGAVSALRGRSLYLQLLTEAIARYTLQELDLPISNLLYLGSGQFQILAPADSEEKLAKIRQSVSRILLHHHQGALSLVLADVKLNPDEFSGKALAAKRKELGKQLQARKNRRFSELGAEIKELFKPQGHGGNEEKQCSVCGQEHEETKPVKDNDGNDTDIRKCPPCDSYERLGKKLRNADYLVLTESKEKTENLLPGTWEEVLHAFGMAANFYEKDELPSASSGQKIVLAIKDEALAELQPGKTRAVGRRYLVNVTPLVEEGDLANYEPEPDEEKPNVGDIKPFKMLAGNKNGAGIHRLGVLRMDVDNLGALFESGFGDEASLGRLNALSAKISQFFEGEVEKLAEQIDGERLYSIYSGGDDLFFVGAWDAVVELAIAIRRDLDRFSGGNPKVHASAGIVLISNKYPLAQAAQAAGKAEHLAKSLRWWGEGKERTKDAITFLGQTLPWQQFGVGGCDQPGLDDAHALMHMLSGLLDDGAARGAIYNLLRLYDRYQEALAKRQQTRGENLTKDHRPQTLWGPWMWLGYYYLKKKKNPQSLKDLAEKLKETRFNAMVYMGLAARWAMLLNRFQGKEQDQNVEEAG